MYQNGGGSMAQFGQMGLNHFSQIQAPQGGAYAVPIMYGQPGMMYPPPMVANAQGQMMGQQMPIVGNQGQYMNGSSQMMGPQGGVEGSGGQVQDSQNFPQGMPNMGRRNQSQPILTQSQNPISKPSEGFRQQDRYSNINKHKEYAHMLDFQLQMKNQKKSELQNYESLQVEKLKQERMRSQLFAQQGQIVRDINGNIVNTKANPANPNYQQQDWFSHMAHKDEFFDPTQQRGSQAQSMNASSIPDLALYDQDLKRQRELEQRLQTAKSQTIINQNQDKITRAQDAFASQPPATNFSRPAAFFGGEVDMVKMRKRQDAIELQREQFEQIEEKKRQKELKILQDKRERELEDFKIERERQEIERRLMEEFKENRTTQKNLQETNFEASLLNSYAGGDSVQPIPLPPPKSALKKRVIQSPPDLYGDANGVRVEQRIVRELPIEVTTTVKETVNNELMRLRNEMNRQSNSLGEQILGMKSHLMMANEKRLNAEKDVKLLQEELKKTQIADEIRQRELYNAFVLTEKPRIHSNNTNKLHQEEGAPFEFPERPKPYYNLQDPYLDNYNNDFKKDNHGILQEQTKHVPVGEYDYTANKIFEKKNIEENFFYDKEEQKEMAKQAISVDTDTLFDLPEDYMNRQNLFYGKNTSDGDGQIDFKDLIIKNQNRLDKLDEIDILQRKGNTEKLDEALFDYSKSSLNNQNYKNTPGNDNNNNNSAYLVFDQSLSRYS